MRSVRSSNTSSICKGSCIKMISERRLERRPTARSLFDREIVGRAVVESFKKLDPRLQYRNPVMFVCEIGALVTFGFSLRDLGGHRSTDFEYAISMGMWLRILFAKFAEGRGNAQADFLRRTKTETTARKLVGGREVTVPANQFRKGDIVRVGAGELIPADGDVIEGAAAVDESAITGESAPVVREAGGDRSAVTGGTRVLSDTIVVRISSNPGESFLDRMIALVEGAQRQKTPNEVALS